MGSISSKNTKVSNEVTPVKDCVFKRIEDPRSPTEEISRTPIEVADKVNNMRSYAWSNILKQQNSRPLDDASPISSKTERSNMDLKKVRNPFAVVEENEQISHDDTENMNSDLEKHE